MLHLHATQLPKPETEVELIPGRKFRFDFVWRERRLVAEVEGGMYAPGGGRHRQREGFERDAEKYNLASGLGFLVVRFTPAMIRSGQAIRTLEGLLKGEVQVKRAELQTGQRKCVACGRVLPEMKPCPCHPNGWPIDGVRG